MIEPCQRPDVVDICDGLLHRQVVDADAENAAVAAQCTGMKEGIRDHVVCGCLAAKTDGNIAEVGHTRR